MVNQSFPKYIYQSFIYLQVHLILVHLKCLTGPKHISPTPIHLILDASVNTMLEIRAGL